MPKAKAKQKRIAPVNAQPERRSKERERDEACAALERMQDARPLCPPPGEIPLRRASAGELAAANDRRLGILGATGPFLDHFE